MRRERERGKQGGQGTRGREVKSVSRRGRGRSAGGVIRWEGQPAAPSSGRNRASDCGVKSLQPRRAWPRSDIMKRSMAGGRTCVYLVPLSPNTTTASRRSRGNWPVAKFFRAVPRQVQTWFTWSKGAPQLPPSGIVKPRLVLLSYSQAPCVAMAVSYRC